MANPKQISVDDIMFYNMRTIVDEDGNLVPLESSHDVPFAIKRIFYVYGVRDSNTRGCHAHYKTKQLLICISGKIEVICKDGVKTKKFLLESPQQALYVPEMIWDEQIYRTENSILLSLCNTRYNPADYIHDFQEFEKIKRDRNGRK